MGPLTKYSSLATRSATPSLVRRGLVWLVRRDRRHEIPVNSAGLLSFVFCTWLDPIMWLMFRHPDYDPIDRCQCPDLEKAAANADR